jgi:hypothetical protein
MNPDLYVSIDGANTGERVCNYESLLPNALTPRLLLTRDIGESQHHDIGLMERDETTVSSVVSCAFVLEMIEKKNLMRQLNTGQMRIMILN